MFYSCHKLFIIWPFDLVVHTNLMLIGWPYMVDQSENRKILTSRTNSTRLWAPRYFFWERVSSNRVLCLGFWGWIIIDYTLIPSNSSGALYHNVTTMGVYGLSGDPYSLARPKSATWTNQFKMSCKNSFQSSCIKIPHQKTLSQSVL